MRRPRVRGPRVATRRLASHRRAQVLQSMNIDQISKVMEKFEQSFEDMDVATSTVDSAMSSATAASTPEDQVDSLMQQVSDAHGLEFKSALGDAGTAPVQQQQAAGSADGEDALEKRLAALRG
jgi:charged multivesicular body protein 1